ncbi:MAG TPA: TonB-dependent receptor [Candidatus Amulumruptor caecigallinarius]|uniref:TonB-dependent receptor n=1 Tax=Candidatus Amulumruptor caecigallinarius TaxID=2109911 RepID=A0A921E7M6_9BACT|nr:TonB-dependent receptor [Candidatus Amulumruptor caecigallinarius]
MKLITIAAFTMTAALGASAATAEKADTTKVLGEVVVVESAAKAPVPLLPLDVKVIGTATIDNSSETNLLPVLQNHVPGMFVTERGLAGYGVSGGAAGTVNIRGVGGGNKVLFLIDGQPQWAGVFGHSLPDTYVTNDVERVEVVSGPSSLLYGSGAMGGSVNLITRRADKEGFSGSLRAAGGSYGTQKYGVKAGYKHGGLRTFVAASYESTDGNREGMDYWLSNQFASVSYDFSQHWEAGANVMLTETKADNPGSVELSQPLDMWTKMFRTTASVYVKNRYDISSGGIQAYYNYGKHKIDDGISRGKPRDYLFNSKDFNMGITAYQTVKPWQGNDLSIGIDFKHWGGEAWNSQKADGKESPIVDKHVNEFAGYAMMQQAFWSDRLSVNAGVRLEHSSQFGNEWVPQAGFILRPLSASRVKFSYSRGFRSPNIRELYMYGPRNAELQPESMDNFEVELRQWLLDGRLNAGLALYYINGDNLIQQVMVDGAARNMNTGSFINKGFEIDATYRLDDDWTFTANYAYLHTDTRIIAAPKNKLFAEIGYTPGRWQFSVDVMSVWDVYTEQTAESYALLNARVAYTFPFQKPLTLFAKGENLTATRYQINYGFPMPRATVMAGAEWRF